jgi:hypothetical protein
VSDRRDAGATAIVGEDSTTPVERERGAGVFRGSSVSVPNDVLTIVSIPALLLIVHFVVRPFVRSWQQLGYVRYAAARTAPAHRVAPDAFTAHAWWWHELTRVTHALVHDPSNHHAHLFGNVVLIGCAAWALLVLLDRLGRREWFVFVYWELVIVGPIVGSYAFDLFGTTPRGYGASTIGYAFLGALLLISSVVLVNEVRGSLGGRLGRGGRSPSPTCSHRDARGARRRPLLVWLLLLSVALVIVIDVVEGSPATPVHQAGVGLGVLVGGTVSFVRRRSIETATRNALWWREESDRPF